MLLEDLGLPVGCEGVADHVREDEGHPEQLRVLHRRVVHLVELEGGDARRDAERHQVLDALVPLARDNVPHEHDRDHLAGLREHLRRERDILERLGEGGEEGGGGGGGGVG